MVSSPAPTPIGATIVAAQGQAPLLVPPLDGSLPDYVSTKLLRIKE